MTFGTGHHLHLIDGSAYIFRAYHALPPLTRKSDGLPVGAVAGFCNILWNELSRATTNGKAATHLAVVFDHSATTFRNAIYDQYKANRPDLPEDLRPQFPLTREATRAFNVACLETEGYEADDIIAALSCRAVEAGGTCTIISSDKDLMQLIRPGVDMFDPMKSRAIGPDEVMEKFGVGPDRVIDVQSLAGDSVDNVPGAPGIGLKTAALLINEYGDLDTLLARAGEIKQPKRREALVDNADKIRISRQLVTLDCDTPLDVTLDDLEIRLPEPDKVMDFLTRMEFRTLTKRVADKLGIAPPSMPDTTQLQVATPREEKPQARDEPHLPFDTNAYECIRDMATLTRWLDRIREVGHVAIDTETTSLDEMRAELVGISLAVDPGKAAYIPLAHTTGGGDLFGATALAPDQLTVTETLNALRPVLEDPSILKIGQNMKYDWKIFARLGIRIAPFDDTMLMSYAMHAGLHNHGMDELSDRYLGHSPIAIKTLLGSGKSQVTFDKVGIPEAVCYAAEDADVTLRLWQRFKPQLHRARVTTVYETLERPLVPVLADMEMTGIQVDRDTLRMMSNAFAQKLVQLEEEIHQVAGEKFNVGSPKQLGEILFDRLQIPGGTKGKTDAYATGADILEDITTLEDHPQGAQLAARILDWRQIAKLKSTYTDALQLAINEGTGRVHTSYSIAGANTGRLASTDPNLQNIPVRTEEGRRIREAFVAPAGRVLVSLDYSQIELRILAHIADIPELRRAFENGIDIHALTASEMFNVPLDQMTSDIRRKAKAINFGVIYGISGFGLARNLRIPRAEAQGFIDRYFERFPGIRGYMTDTVKFAQANGHVQTLFGRKINTPEINAKGPGAGFAKRAAINAPIQGTAADVIRRAMIRMPQAIAGLDAKMLLQVHDELLFEVSESDADRLIPIAKEVMESASSPAVSLNVHLAVEAGKGRNWAEAH
ncbi:DNA polymerase I [Tabrizicola sp.]|uniref:DNA polymerase I n=1 Tax=Tabrizicola sp. TaxID=2005166 RepID=UPI0027326F33|nr:DNA polymerase I [Tabrizicola sp.]MDP3195527.1 DNA polymerase I [Tabrizicola sp.]MDZ4066479.1 DNA polymerase I [Tabrizicola sp.]